MRDDVFEKLSIDKKLIQIRKNQKSAVWYNYTLFVLLVILIGVGFLIT
jgi:hypothetical protein